MARPLKSGVDYFPKDTDFYFDDKVRILRAEFGAKGMYILDYLLCEIYRTNGYFLKWDKSRCFLVSDGAGCGCSPEYISEFVAGCIRCSFFDKRVLDVFGVLTSAGIQRRYVRMFNSRPSIEIYREYWLLNENNPNDVPTSVLGKIAFKKVFCTENPLKSTENPLKSTETPINNNRINDTNVSKSKSMFVVPAELTKAWNAFAKMRASKEKPLTDRSSEMILEKLDNLAPNDRKKQIAILEQSVMYSWVGVYPLKEEPETQRSYDIEQLEKQLWNDPIVFEKKEGD